MPMKKGWKRKKLHDWKRVCAPGSLRIKFSGKSRVLVCCPKGKLGKNDRCKVGMTAVSVDSPGRFGAGFSGVKPAFRSGARVFLSRAGFPGTPTNTRGEIVEVRKGGKRDGYAHRYLVRFSNGRDLWANEGDLSDGPLF